MLAIAMTQEPEPKPDQKNTPSVERRFVQRSLQTFIAWCPLGGSGFVFVSFLLKQEWAMSLLMFPVTAITGVWAAYSKNFIERLIEIYTERSKADADGLVKGMDHLSQNVTESLKESFKSLDFESKYLKCQAWACHEDDPVGLSEDEDLPINNPLLQEVFVPLQLSADSMEAGYVLRELKEDCSVMQIWDLLRNVQSQPSLRQIAIRAWGGYGKTTLLKHLAYTYSVREYGKYRAPKFIPFLLYLAGCWQEITKENPPNLPDLLTTYHVHRLPLGQELTMPPAWALNLLKQGEALVMFDGFDEVPPAERTAVSEWLSREMQQYRHAVFILTSRPTAYKENYTAKKPTASFWIQDFDQKQRQQFVEQWYLCQERHARGGRNTPDVQKKVEERTASLLAQIQARPELNDIAGNVLLLHMMARFHRNKQGAELPQRKVELYQDICEMQLGRRPKGKGIGYLLLNSIHQRQEVLQFVALEMMKRAAIDQEDQAGFKQIQRDDLLELITNALVERDPDIAPLAFLGQMVQVSELLVEREGGIYQFSHLSFQEFLAASEIVRLKQAGKALLYEQLGLDAWKDTILFYASLVNPTELLQEAINRHKQDLAYQIYRQTDKRLNLSPAERQALEGVKETVKTSRYQQLEEYLKAQQWQEADQETYRLMIAAVGKDEGQVFDEEDLRNFPCDELLAIDRLWVQYSNGLYGFSVQKQIYVECGGKLDFSYPDQKTWDKFCDRVAWKEQGSYVSYSNLFLKKHLKISGHLPWRWSGRSVAWGVYFFSRIKTCEV